MQDQKDLFQLPDDIHYINCAYMSPLLRSAVEAGNLGMQKKINPSVLTKEDFFDEAEEIRNVFSKIIGCQPQETAIIPSASYGLAAAMQNLPLQNGNTAITIGSEFPSDYYALQRWCELHKKHLKIIAAPKELRNRGKHWNTQLLEAITNDTAVVVMSSVCWEDGTLFDLQQIGKRCAETETVFIVDGTQSVGALPLHVKECKIDALICAGYKWLFGPYTTGVAYYSEKFQEGIPLEETWMNRINAAEFSRLTDYTPHYKSGSSRYNMGEFSNFILNPMLLCGLQQVFAWTPGFIQHYCAGLIAPLLAQVEQKGWGIEDAAYRGNHLFGLQLPAQIQPDHFYTILQQRKIFVSLRGNSIRISPHVYNTEKDISALMQAIDEVR